MLLLSFLFMTSHSPLCSVAPLVCLYLFKSIDLQMPQHCKSSRNQAPTCSVSTSMAKNTSAFSRRRCSFVLNQDDCLVRQKFKACHNNTSVATPLLSNNTHTQKTAVTCVSTKLGHFLKFDVAVYMQGVSFIHQYLPSQVSYSRRQQWNQILLAHPIKHNSKTAATTKELQLNLIYYSI